MVRHVLAAAVAAVFAFSSVTQAGIISIESNSSQSTEALGEFEATLEYIFTGGNTGKLVIEITNTSPLANGGFITGIAFNAPGDGFNSVLLFTDSELKTLLGEPDFEDSVSASPFGKFDLAASLTSGFNGSGNPNPGIGVGQTGNFTFSFTGAGLDTWTTSDFLSAFNSGGSPGYDPAFFLVRFRGFADGGSDKVPGVFVPDPRDDDDVVEHAPEPSSLLLWSLAGAALVFQARRRRRIPA